MAPDSTFLPSLSLYMGRTGATRHSGNATYTQVGKLPNEIRDTLEAELLALLDRDRYQLELINVREFEDEAYHSWKYE